MRDIGLGWFRYPGGVLALLLCLAASPDEAGAEDLTAPAEREEPFVVILIASGEQRETTNKLIRAVEGQLSDLPIELRVEWVEEISESLPREIHSAREISERNDASVVVWCDLGHNDEVYLYLTRANERRILIRTLDKGQEGVKYESLALIVHSVVDAIMHGGRIGVEVTEAIGEASAGGRDEPKPEPEPAPEPEEGRKTVSFALSIGYDLRTYSPEQPVLNGLRLGVAVVVLDGLHLFAGYVFRPAIELKVDDVAFEVRTNPISLGGGYAWRLGRFRLGAALAATGDYVVQRTRSVPTSTAVKKDNENFVFSLAPLLSGVLLLTERVALDLSLGVQFDLTAVEYTAGVGPDEVLLDAPWRVAFRGGLGLLFVF